MALENRSEAYDFSLFEERSAFEVPAQQNNVIDFPDVQQGSRNKGKVFKALLKFLSMAVIFTVVLNLVYSEVRLTEITDQISEAKATLSEQEGEETRLLAQSALRYSLQTVQEYAENELGMKKISQSQTEYFSVSNGDSGEVLCENSEKTWFDDFVGAIGELLS